MKHALLFQVLNDGMGATDAPEALLRHATRQRGVDNPAPRPERQMGLATLFTVQEAF